MSTERTSLDMDFDDLDDFKPVARSKPKQGTRKKIDEVSAFPSREASAEGQLNMKGRKIVLDRFKAMCKADRRPYVEMLEILIDAFEGNDHK